MNENKICPRCKGHIPNDQTPGKYPGALSRVDNKTEICSSCGTDEAMFNMQRPNDPLPPLGYGVFGDTVFGGEG